ncbi:hypothetical protein MUN84_10395 [Hymenobacter sp. 5516J-16]|uniref:DUF1735 domain-containing protein n=1 Tax=Hymenobacter sublimis TaxID=2933777 RepID=A0ABY4JBV3_9BACT|nr:MULTISPECIES: hypothetical protein [Hymenobacter]UOQ78896.1 hypothetical protein MUN84_10395 [Hymenobacter sp. 5516J-16]UPL48854.1 hypothetical protein MWH26_16910 [Hymenobacter sublimis]
MKKILFLAPVLLLLAILSSCDKLDKLLTFYIEDSQSVKIASAFPIGQVVPLTPIAVTTRSDEKFKNENTSASLVKDVKLDRLTLTITDPNSENFDFLQSITIYISTDANDKIMLASLDNIPTGVNTLQLTPSTQKLDKYVKASSYTLSTEAKIRKPISRDITIRTDSRFKVTADPL